MSDELRSRLLEKRNRIIENVAQGILAGNRKNFDDELKQIADIDSLVADIPQVSDIPQALNRQRVTAAVIGSVCVLMIGFGWVIRVPESRITLQAQSKTVFLILDTIKSNKFFPRISSREIRLSKFSEITLPDIIREPHTFKDDTRVILAGSDIWFATLELKKKSELHIQRLEAGFIDLSLKGALMHGELGMIGKVQITVIDEKSGRSTLEPITIKGVPETVTFVKNNIDGAPANIRIMPQQEISLYDLPISKLSFGYQVSDEPGSQIWVSSLLTGTLNLTDIGKEYTLRTGKPVSFENLHGRISKLRIGKTIDIRLEGYAKTIRIGPDGFEQDLTPRLLEFIYNNQRLSFFFTAITFLWGMIWSLRKLWLLNS